MNIEQLVLRPSDRQLFAHSRNGLGAAVHSSISFDELDSDTQSAIDLILASAARTLPEDVPDAVVAEIRELEARLAELRSSIRT